MAALKADVGKEFIERDIRWVCEVVRGLSRLWPSFGLTCSHKNSCVSSLNLSHPLPPPPPLSKQDLLGPVGSFTNNLPILCCMFKTHIFATLFKIINIVSNTLLRYSLMTFVTYLTTTWLHFYFARSIFFSNVMVPSTYSLGSKRRKGVFILLSTFVCFIFISDFPLKSKYCFA